jgi:hypothetical protein
MRHPFSRSYGAILPSSLTWFISRTLGFSPRLPVSVYGTDTYMSTRLELFSTAEHQPKRFARKRTAASVLRLNEWFSPTRPTTLPRQPKQSIRPSIPCPSVAQYKWYRNINLLSIDYAFRPRLRIRLTLGGRAFPRKPWAFGDQDSHLVFRYSCLHGHLCAVHARLPSHFDPHTTLSYRTKIYSPRSPVQRTRRFLDRVIVEINAPAVSVSNLSPDHFRRRTTRPVSYYALFKWWLPLSQHPGCLRSSTSLNPLSSN